MGVDARQNRPVLPVIRQAVSPALIMLGMALNAHFLAMAWVDWSACFETSPKQASPYRDYLTDLLSNWGVAVLTLVPPFLPFLLVSVLVRAVERLFWQWVGIGITIIVLSFVLSGISHPCPDEGDLAKYGVPELIPMFLGGPLGFLACLVVTYIGSIRHARRADP